MNFIVDQSQLKLMKLNTIDLGPGQQDDSVIDTKRNGSFSVTVNKEIYSNGVRNNKLEGQNPEKRVHPTSSKGKLPKNSLIGAMALIADQEKTKTMDNSE